jgi:hypothetical protein
MRHGLTTIASSAPLLLLVVLIILAPAPHALVVRRLPMASATSNLNLKSRDPASNMPST